MILTVQQRLNLLDLYAEEICARIGQNLFSLGSLTELLHKKEVESLIPKQDKDVSDDEDVPEHCKNLIDEVESTERACKLWEHLKKSALVEQLYMEILAFLKNGKFLYTVVK